MLMISVNGQKTEVMESLTLVALIKAYNPEDNPVAVAINGEFLAKSEYQNVSLKSGDKIDIVSPVGGG